MGPYQKCITEWMERKKTSLAKFSRQVGIPQSTLKHHLDKEDEEPVFTPSRLFRVLKITGHNLTDFFDSTAAEQFEFEFQDKIERDDPDMLGRKIRAIVNEILKRGGVIESGESGSFKTELIFREQTDDESVK